MQVNRPSNKNQAYTADGEGQSSTDNKWYNNWKRLQIIVQEDPEKFAIGVWRVSENIAKRDCRKKKF